MRDQHMEANLEKTNYSIDLFLQYKKHLGKARYQILKQAQLLVVPQRVKTLLNFGNISWLKPAVPLYKFSRIIKLDGFVKAILLPSDYKKQIREIDVK
ncbi:MAG: oxygenase MpaB family protein, partial [Flavisolibacter sp.]